MAPLLTLNADWAIMRLPEQDDYVGKSVQFVGINPDGPAGILPAGFKGSITFQALSVSAQGHVGIKYDLQVASENVPIDWASHKAEMRPASIPVDAWDAVFANFVAQVGSTTASYRQAIANDATYLSQFGEVTYDLNRMVFLEYMKANADLSAGTLASSVDASMPSPGLPLTFERTYNATITGRYDLGRLGPRLDGQLGHLCKHRWKWKCDHSSEWHRHLLHAKRRRQLQRKPRQFHDALAASGLLSASIHGRHHGSLPARWQLDYIQDTNGNRITAGYDGSGRLISLTQTSGASLTLAYNAQGRISLR